MQKPSVGRVVHYVSHGTPVRGDGSQAFTSRCRAAIITEVESADSDGMCVGLVALNPTGMFFHSLVDGGCPHDAGGTSDTSGAPTARSYEGGTWHWPERID